MLAVGTFSLPVVDFISAGDILWDMTEGVPLTLEVLMVAGYNGVIRHSNYII